MMDRAARNRDGRTHAGRVARRDWILAAILALLVLHPATARANAEPTATANFHTIGLYWSREQNAAGVAIQYRPDGSVSWKDAQPLWWDQLSAIPAYLNQYRGSIVNLSPGTLYNIRYSLDGGTSWVDMANVATRGESLPGTTTRYTGTRTTKLVITKGGTATNWKIHDGQGTAVIDPGHTDDCIQIKASYVIVRGFNIQDCKYSAVDIEKPNVVIENNTIQDWGSQEIAFDNPAPRLGAKSKKILSDPSSTCIGGTDKADIGRLGDAGINVLSAGNDGVVIQRNVIRDPRYRSTRWQECPGYDSHPYGPRSINIGASASESGFGKGNVIRYNEIYASNTTDGGATLASHSNRYYDVIGANYQQDLDIYCNIIRNGTDDAIEVDNAAVNVRIWGNYIDYALTMISHQHMEAGPSYVFRNIFDRGADNDVGNPGTWNVGVNGGYTSDSPLKYRQNNGGTANFNGPAYVFHNTALRTEEDGFNYGYSIFVETASKDNGEYRNVISQNNILMAARNYMYDTSPKNWLDSTFADMYNRDQNMNYPYSLAGGLMMTVDWKSGHGPSAPWTVPPATPTGRYQATNAGTGVPLANFNDAASMGRGAHQYEPSADTPMRFGVTADWTYVPAS
jgi:hypothetical protein